MNHLNRQAKPLIKSLSNSRMIRTTRAIIMSSLRGIQARVDLLKIMEINSQTASNFLLSKKKIQVSAAT